jgi:hypothetical protein
MLDSYGFGAGAAASAIAIVGVFNVFATLVMPVLGVVALLGDLVPGSARTAGRAGTVTVAWTEALAAFAFARAALVIPATPGGLGTVDAALTALLTGFGATSTRPWAPTWCGGPPPTFPRCCWGP